MSKVYPRSLETVYNTFEKIGEVWISNDFFKFIYQISIEFWIKNSLLHKFFQADMIFFNQFKVPTIKFGKCFAELMIPIALHKEFGRQELVTIIEVSNMRRCSGKANKLRYTCIYTIREAERDIDITERKINNIEIKIIPLIINVCRNCIIMNR